MDNIILKCSQCGVENESVKNVIDPFKEEVCNIIEYKNLCSKCYQDSIDDI